MSKNDTAPRTLRFSLGPVRQQVERRTLIVAAILIVLTVLFALLVMMNGPLRMGMADVVRAVFGEGDRRSLNIIQRSRLPRTVTAVGVGVALGAAGCIFQSVSRNALGSPDIIGFTTGAATGAVVQIVFFNQGGFATSAAAVAAGLVTAALVYALARHKGKTGGYRLVLVGIGVSSFVGALNTLMLAKGDLDLATKARVWLSGSLNARTWDDATVVWVAVLIAVPALIVCARLLNVMEMGDDQAHQLGVRPERVRQVTMLAGVVLTAAAVAAAGPIAFVALAAPQLTARFTRAARVQVVLSGLTGAALLVAADLLSILLPVRLAMPVGLTTGLLGGLYLMWLLTRTKTV
ncbi:MAG: FecCD family ABC transporter permease [Galactobacter sp.]